LELDELEKLWESKKIPKKKPKALKADTEMQQHDSILDPKSRSNSAIVKEGKVMIYFEYEPNKYYWIKKYLVLYNDSIVLFNSKEKNFLPKSICSRKTHFKY